MSESSESSSSSASTVKDPELNQSTEVTPGDKRVDNELSLELAKFSFKDSIDLDVLFDPNTSTSRIEADEEDNADFTPKQRVNIQQQQQKKPAKTANSTPLSSLQHLLPKSRLRSGKLFRRSKSSEPIRQTNEKQNCEDKNKELEQNSKVTDRILSFKKPESELQKFFTVEYKKASEETNFDLENKNKNLKLTDKNTISNTQTTQHTNNSKKMVAISEINALVSCSVPILTGDINSNLRSEVNVFIKCCEKIEACLTEADEKTMLLRLITTRIRGRAAEAIEGSTCESLDGLKKILLEKLLKSRPYHVLRSELQMMRQYPGESVESFGNRLQNLLKECKESVVLQDQNSIDAIHRDLEEQALYVFKAGIHNTNLKWFCLSDTETALSALLEKAVKLENTERQMSFAHKNKPLNQSISPTPANRTSTPYHPNYTNANYPANSYSQNPTQRSNTAAFNNSFRPISESTARKQIKCNFCGKKGHYFSDCRIRKNTPFCGICKLYGHLAASCKEKNRHNFNDQKQVHSINKNRSKNKKSVEMICEFCKRRNHKIQDCAAKKDWDKKNSAQPSGNQ